jgi:hypothetical protein
VDLVCATEDTARTVCTTAQKIRISGSIHAPVELTPIKPPPPPGHDTPRCTDASTSTSWVISHFEWRTGGYKTFNPFNFGNVDIWGPALLLSMSITNTATNHSTWCTQRYGSLAMSNITSSSYQSPFGVADGPIWVDCLTNIQAEQYINNYNAWTSMKLDPIERLLYIDQTWYCDDHDPEKP